MSEIVNFLLYDFIYGTNSFQNKMKQTFAEGAWMNV